MAGKTAKSNDKGKAKPSSGAAVSPKKARHAAAWTRGQARKAERRRVQDEAWARNRETRARGGLTPWQQAKYAAKLRKGVGSRDVTPGARERAIAAGAVRSAGGGEASNISSNAVEVEAVPVARSGGGKREAIRKAKRREE